MNENYNNCYNEKMEINLVNLMFYLLKRWRSLCVCVVLGVLLGTGTYLLKSSFVSELEVDQMLEDEEETVVAEQLKISSDSITNMELAYQYRELYQGQIEYNKNSILMKLNPNETYKGVLEYYLAAGDNTEIISLLYQNVIKEQEFIQNIREQASLDCEEQYVKELVSCTLNGNENTFININNITGELLNSANSISQSEVLTYGFVYGDEETCEKVLALIRERLDELNLECQEKYGEFISEIVLDDVQFVADNSRLDKQKSDIDVMNACLTNSTKLESTFTDEEMAYYETVYLGRAEDGDAAEAVDIENETEQSSKGTAKWLLIGVLLAVVCWGGYYLIQYLFDKHIKYAEELPNYYNLHLIGRYQNEGKLVRGVDKLQNRVANKNLGGYNNREYIASVLELMDVDSLYLTGNTKDEEIKEFLESIKKSCTKAEYGDLLQNSSLSVEEAKGKGVVLVVKKDYNTHTEVQRELEIYRLQKIRICGTIVME